MIEQKISAALATRLSTLGLPTQYENSQYSPVAGVTYLKEDLLPADNTSITLNQSTMHSGIYQVSVYAPKDANKGGGYAIAKQVLEKFERGLRLTYDGLTVTIMSASQSPAFISSDRWVVPVSIIYRAFE